MATVHEKVTPIPVQVFWYVTCLGCTTYCPGVDVQKPVAKKIRNQEVTMATVYNKLILIQMWVFWYATPPGVNVHKPVAEEKIRYQRVTMATDGVTFILGPSLSRWYMALLAKPTSFRERLMTWIGGRKKNKRELQEFWICYKIRVFHPFFWFLVSDVRKLCEHCRHKNVAASQFKIFSPEMGEIWLEVVTVYIALRW